MIALLLSLWVTPASAQATHLTPRDIENRKLIVAQAYKRLAETIPIALENERMAGWLEHLHFSKDLFQQVKDEATRRSAKPIDRAQVEYYLPDNQMSSCHGGSELGKQVDVVAYTMQDRVIHLCSIFFIKETENERAEVLLHEHIHVAGIFNECDTEAVAFLTFYAAGRATQPAYLQRCAVFKEFFENLIEFDQKEAKFDVESNFSLSPKVSDILLREKSLKIQWCELKLLGASTVTSPISHLLLKKIDHADKTIDRYIFKDIHQREVDLNCASQIVPTNEKLTGLGLKPEKLDPAISHW